MLFNAPDFLFGFLPVFLFVYFIAGRRLRNLVLFGSSLLFYFATSGELTIILALSVLVNWALALHLASAQGRRRRTGLARPWAFSPTCCRCYTTNMRISSWASSAIEFVALGLPISPMPTIDPPLPIGISFFTFQAISYVADTALARVRPAHNLIDFGMYHSCFPQLIAGPIVRYEEIADQVAHRRHTIEDIYNGVVQFCFGLGKKVLLANSSGRIADAVFQLPDGGRGFSAAWIGIAAYTLQIYFDFSGYSDMAIGLGRILGMWYPENFNQPYLSRSVTEFWRRWHMTLSRWFRDYVYIQLGGNRLGIFRTLLNLVLVFFLCGLWHGAAYTFVVWGLLHGALLMISNSAGTVQTGGHPPSLAGPIRCSSLCLPGCFSAPTV